MPNVNRSSKFGRFTLVTLAGLAILPLAVSLLLHGAGLYLSDKVRWGLAASTVQEETPQAATVELRQGQRDDRLKFQGEDSQDSFRADDLMAYPTPDIDYQPVAPDVEYFPDAAVRDRSDIISIQAATVDRQWANPVTGRQPLNTGYERLVGSFSRHIEVLREGGLDVVFVFDSTHSMASFLLEVKQKIEYLSLAFKTIVPTSRIGLVAYQDDDAESRFVTRMQPLTYGTVSLQDFLGEMEAWGGTDLEEAVDLGLKVAVEEMAWNKKSKKFILLIGDAPPHAEDMFDTLALVEKFRTRMGGKVAVIDTRPMDTERRAMAELHLQEELRDFGSESHSYAQDSSAVLDEFRSIAQAGGGESARLQNDEKVIIDMLLLVFGSKWQNYLGEFTRQL